MNKRQKKKKLKQLFLYIQQVVQRTEENYQRIDAAIKADPAAMKEYFLNEPKSSVVDLLIAKCEREIKKVHTKPLQ